MLFGQIAADIQQELVLYSRRTSRFARPACQTTIQVQLSLARRLLALKHLLDEIDTTTRTIQFIAQKLVGWTGCIAKTAMDTGSENGVRLFPDGRLLICRANTGLHSPYTISRRNKSRNHANCTEKPYLENVISDYKPGYSLPGLRMP